jgi:hypothetical protein
MAWSNVRGANENVQPGSRCASDWYGVTVKSGGAVVSSRTGTENVWPSKASSRACVRGRAVPPCRVPSATAIIYQECGVPDRNRAVGRRC